MAGRDRSHSRSERMREALSETCQLPLSTYLSVCMQGSGHIPLLLLLRSVYIKYIKPPCCHFLRPPMWRAERVCQESAHQ